MNIVYDKHSNTLRSGTSFVQIDTLTVVSKSGEGISYPLKQDSLDKLKKVIITALESVPNIKIANIEKYHIVDLIRFTQVQLTNKENESKYEKALTVLKIGMNEIVAELKDITTSELKDLSSSNQTTIESLDETYVPLPTNNQAYRKVTENNISLPQSVYLLINNFKIELYPADTLNLGNYKINTVTDINSDLMLPVDNFIELMENDLVELSKSIKNRKEVVVAVKNNIENFMKYKDPNAPISVTRDFINTNKFYIISGNYTLTIAIELNTVSINSKEYKVKIDKELITNIENVIKESIYGN